MKVFVTGATGFLGSHLVDRLLEKKWEVHALVRHRSNLQWLLGKKIHYHYGDLIDDLTGLKEGLKGADYCFHLAGVMGASRPETYYEVNAQGTANLLETTLKVNPKIKKIIVVTSLAAHGPGYNDTPATEEETCHPITDYGRSKRDAELITLRYRDYLPVTLIRPPAIYGPRDRQILRYFWMARKGFVLTPGRKGGILNLAYVQDVVTGLLLAAEHPKATGEIFFIGDEKNYSWEEAAVTIAQSVRRQFLSIRIPRLALRIASQLLQVFAWCTGRPDLAIRANLKNAEQRNWALTIDKARRLLGYRPEYSLQRGVEETAAWYRDQGWL